MRRLVPLAILLLGACSNELSGRLTVDGQPFVFDGCRSGRVFGFTGVVLEAADGRRVGIVQTPTGNPDVVVFAAGAEVGQKIPECGSFTVQNQNSTINDVRNVEGRAKLQCRGGGHEIEGEVTFANCH